MRSERSLPKADAYACGLRDAAPLELDSTWTPAILAYFWSPATWTPYSGRVGIPRAFARGRDGCDCLVRNSSLSPCWMKNPFPIYDETIPAPPAAAGDVKSRQRPRSMARPSSWGKHLVRGVPAPVSLSQRWTSRRRSPRVWTATSNDRALSVNMTRCVYLKLSAPIFRLPSQGYRTAILVASMQFADREIRTSN